MIISSDKGLVKGSDILMAISSVVSGSYTVRNDFVCDYDNSKYLKDLECEKYANGTFYKAPPFMLVYAYTPKRNIIDMPYNNIDKKVISVIYFDDLKSVVNCIKDDFIRNMGIPTLFFFNGSCYEKKVYYMGKSVVDNDYGCRCGGYTQSYKQVMKYGINDECRKVYYDEASELDWFLDNIKENEEIFMEIPDLWEVTYFGLGDEVENRWYTDFHSLDALLEDCLYSLLECERIAVECSEYRFMFEIDEDKVNFYVCGGIDTNDFEDMDCCYCEDFEKCNSPKGLKDYLEDDEEAEGWDDVLSEVDIEALKEDFGEDDIDWDEFAAMEDSPEDFEFEDEEYDFTEEDYENSICNHCGMGIDGCKYSDGSPLSDCSEFVPISEEDDYVEAESVQDLTMQDKAIRVREFLNTGRSEFGMEEIFEDFIKVRVEFIWGFDESDIYEVY